jgi:hypothetical protein
MELRHNLANEYTVAKRTIEQVRDLLAMLLQGINWEHGRSPGGWSGGLRSLRRCPLARDRTAALMKTKIFLLISLFPLAFSNFACNGSAPPRT